MFCAIPLFSSPGPKGFGPVYKKHRLLRGDGRGGGVVVTASGSSLLGYGWSAGLGVGLIVTTATFRPPASRVDLGGIAPGTLGTLVALVNGARAGSSAIPHALALALTLPAAPALALLAFAAHLRHTGHRPEQNHGQSQDQTDRQPLIFFHLNSPLRRDLGCHHAG